MELFKQQTDLQMTHVPYRGIAPAFTDLIGGQTQAMFPGLAAAMPHIKSGRDAAAGRHRRVRAIRCCKTCRRSTSSAYKGSMRVQWYGVVGPAGMPADVVQTLNDTLNSVLRAPELQRETVGRGGRADADDRRASSATTCAPTSRAGPSSHATARSNSTTDESTVASFRVHSIFHPSHRSPHMARNTQVNADHDAPPVTRILAEFVASHPSRGWSDAVDHEAHRTFLNWLGCAVGAARHEAVEAALAAVQVLQPAPQATRARAHARGSTSPARRCSTASPRTPSTSTTRT